MRRLALPLALLCACASDGPSSDVATETGSTGDDPTMSDSSSSTGPTTTDATETDPSSETDTEDSTTTGPTGCQGPADCVDPALPFCVDEFCVACSATATPDDACAELDPGLPLCIDDACVQCSDDDASACSGATPLCDALANTCVACEFHEQCQDIGSPACNFITGACFDPEAVSEVNAGTGGAVQAAIDEVANGAEHAIVITGDGAEQTIVVDAGKTIAIVSNNTSTKDIDGNEGAPTLTVTGAGTTVFLHRIRLTLNGDDVGVAVQTPAALFADSSQVSQNTGGGISIATGASAQLRNCMVAGDGGDPGVPAVTSTGGTLNILYSTLGLDFNNGGPTLECSGGTVTVRNSIVVSDSSVAGSALQCPGADIQASFVDNDSGADIWFASMSTGSYHLTAAGQAQFVDVAVWEDGDPPFDFDGDARPAVDGSPDYAGADTIP